MSPTPPSGPASAPGHAERGAAPGHADVGSAPGHAERGCAPVASAPPSDPAAGSAPDRAAAVDAVLAVIKAKAAGAGKPAAPAWHRKVRYHHRDLRASALARGREIVAMHGPTGLTLRGLARDLGVTAPALVHVFGTVAMLREAVAASVLEQIEAACGMDQNRRPAPCDVAADWIAWAAANANLYRLACGEGWNTQERRPTGAMGTFATYSPRRFLERAFFRRSRRYGKPKGDIEGARRYAFAIHGLAVARVDGVPEEEVARELERLLA